MKSLYIHIPFCEQKCFYCSFVVSIGQEQRMDTYLDCIALEAHRYKGEQVKTIYIGGGTPTLMSEKQIQKLNNIIQENFILSQAMEWTIEANPERLNSSKLKLLKTSGINRVSLGVQTMNNKYLKYLGRNHNAQAAVNSYKRIRKAGFENINIDLMFSFPKQTMRELKEDVKTITQLGSDHVSLYSLTIEHPSRFFAKKIQLQNDNFLARQYKLVCDLVGQAGYEQYEVSNFAKASNHNYNYWRGGQYIGLGIGAHSYIDSKRFWNISQLDKYIQNSLKGYSTQEGFENLTPHDKMKEAILFGLRMNNGVNVKQAEKRYHSSLSQEQQKKINVFIESGFLVRDNDHLKTSSKGRLVLDELCAQLV